MENSIRPNELGKFIRNMQGEQPSKDFAVGLGINYDSFRTLVGGHWKPQQEILSKFGLELVYRKGSKYILPTELGTYMRKLQGDKSDINFAAELNVTRQAIYGMRNGVKNPKAKTLDTLGFETLYRKVSTNGSQPAKKTVAKRVKK